MWSVLILVFPLPLHFSPRWHLVRWRWGVEGMWRPTWWPLVPWSSCPGPSPGLEVAEGGVPPWSRPLKTLAGGTPVLLVMLRHAWWGSWRALLHFGSCRHVSPLGLCHVLRPAHSLAGWHHLPRRSGGLLSTPTRILLPSRIRPGRIFWVFWKQKSGES